MTQEDNGKPSEINDPDAQNAEQVDETAQAQEIAEEVLHEPFRQRRTHDSTHGGGTSRSQLIPDDVPDLVDRMKEMDNSGRIDMTAFDGEEDMDDQPEDEI